MHICALNITCLRHNLLLFVVRNAVANLMISLISVQDVLQPADENDIPDSLIDRLQEEK